MSFARSHPFVTALAVAAIAFLWVPLAMVVVNSINRDPQLARWGGATFGWFREAITDPVVRAGLFVSLKVGLVTTLLSIVLALTGVLWWRSASSRGRRLFDILVYSRIVLPEIVFGMALFLVFTRARIQLGIPTMVIGHVVWGSAYATVILQARARLLDPAVEEAASDLGATPFAVFLRVTFPSLLPGILAAAILTFTLSFDDIVTSFFVAGTGNSTLPLIVFGMVRFHVTPEVNAIGAMVTSFMILSLLLALWLVTRSVRGPGSLANRLGF